jgi:Sulfotransferase family
MLIPILVAGYGRTGTTGLMARLSTSPSVAVDREYPFENRYLTYLTKFALLAGRPGASSLLDPLQLDNYSDDHFGPAPWATASTPQGALMPSMVEWILGAWRVFSESVRRRHPEATCYAEKVPAWLWPTVRDVLPCRALHLVRDPRDIFLSARAFVNACGAIGFGMEPGRSDMEQARHTAHGLLMFAENERAGRLRPDARRVRYEDMIEDEEPFIERLNEFLGLGLSAEESDRLKYLSRHMTSPSLAASVRRWHREDFPAGVRESLETQMHGAMQDYGYELPRERSAPSRITPDPSMRCSPDGHLRRSENGAVATVTGRDFWVELTPGPGRAEGVAEVWACLRGGTGDHCSVYWRDESSSFMEERSVHVAFRPGPHWQIVRFHVAAHPLWRGSLEPLRLDLFNGTVGPGAEGEVQWVSYVE